MCLQVSTAARDEAEQLALVARASGRTLPKYCAAVLAYGAWLALWGGRALARLLGALW